MGSLWDESVNEHLHRVGTGPPLGGAGLFRVRGDAGLAAPRSGQGLQGNFTDEVGPDMDPHGKAGSDDLLLRLVL